MLSKALAHYPQFRFREGEKRLWNPVLKQTFAPRPEERVRLRLIDFLLIENGHSSNRISFESPVKLAGDKTSSRTDIICYDKQVKPLLLVECKAPEIKLDEKAALQVARYNQEVGAPYVLVSNGVLDYWFTVSDKDIQLARSVPALFESKKSPKFTIDYWQDRAFAGTDLDKKYHKKMTSYCVDLYSDAHQPVKYIGFDGVDPELSLRHYYRIFGLNNESRVALSLSATAKGGSRLNVVLNVAGDNTAFCSTSLDKLWKGEKENSELHSAKGKHVFDLAKIPGLVLDTGIKEWVSPLYDLLNEYS